MSMPPPGHPAHPGSYEYFLQQSGQWSEPPIQRDRCVCGAGAFGYCECCWFPCCDEHSDGNRRCLACVATVPCQCGEPGPFVCEDCSRAYCHSHGESVISKVWDSKLSTFRYRGAVCAACLDVRRVAAVADRSLPSALIVELLRISLLGRCLLGAIWVRSISRDKTSPESIFRVPTSPVRICRTPTSPVRICKART